MEQGREDEGEEDKEKERDGGPERALEKSPFQFRLVRVQEMLEALVSESSTAEEQLRMELEGLRAQGARGSAQQEMIDEADRDEQEFLCIMKTGLY